MTRLSMPQRPLRLLIYVFAGLTTLILTYYGLLYMRFQMDAPVAHVAKPASIAQARRQDLDQLRLFFQLEKSWTPGTLARAEGLYQRLTGTAADLSDAQFDLAVAEIVASAGNAHTKILEYNRTPRYNRLPLRGHWFADGYFIIRAFQGYEDFLGMQLLSVDGIPLPQVASRLRKYIAGNDGTFHKYLPYLLESPELLHAAGIARNPGFVGLALRGNGQLQTRRVAAEKSFSADQIARSYMLLAPAVYRQSQPRWTAIDLDPQSLPLYLRKPIEQLQIAQIPDLNAYYIQFWTNNDTSDRSVEAFCNDGVAEYKLSRRRLLIIDQRFNGGGDMHKTYRCMQNLAASVAPDGHIFLIIGGATFSAGIYSAAAVVQQARAKTTIVGEDVGDALVSWGEDNLLVLPNSSIQIKFSTGEHDIAHGCTDWRRCYWGTMFLNLRVESLAPDLRTPLSFSDYANEIDPAMAAIRQYARSGSATQGASNSL